MERVHALYGDHAGELLELYPAATDYQAKRSAQDLAGDRFIAFSTWKWIDMQLATGNSRVYRYEFDDAPPAPKDSTEPSRGAYHSARLSSCLRRCPRKNFRGGRRTRSCRISCRPTGLTSPKPGTRTVRAYPTGRSIAARKEYEVMHLDASPHSAPDRTGAGTNYLTLCHPMSSKCSARYDCHRCVMRAAFGCKILPKVR